MKNKSIKKLLALSLCTALLLAGCGGNATQDGSSGDVNEHAEVATDNGSGEDAAAEEEAESLPKEDAQEAFTKAGIETDIPDLSSVLASADGLGEDAIVGACVGSSTMHDGKLMAIAEKHFNAITLENELKLDCMLGYNNEAPAPDSIHEEELNGETIEVPTLDHSRADAVLDKMFV